MSMLFLSAVLSSVVLAPADNPRSVRTTKAAAVSGRAGNQTVTLAPGRTPPPAPASAAPAPTPAPSLVEPALVAPSARPAPVVAVAATPAPVPVVQSAPLSNEPVALVDPDYSAETITGSVAPNGASVTLLYRNSAINNDSASMVGLRADWLLNHSMFLGVGGFMALADPQLVPTSSTISRQYINFGYAGLDVGYALFPQKLVHVNLRALVGLGGVTHYSNLSQNVYGPSLVYVGEPSVEVVINVAPMIRVNLGIGYRFSAGIQLPNMASNGINGLNFDIGVEGGIF